MLRKNLFIAIPVYNEEKNISRLISSLHKEVRTTGLNVITYLCLNGCTDRSLDIAITCQKDYPSLNIEILHSQKGKLYAQKKIIDEIKDTNIPIAFIDADVEIVEGSFKIILEELDKHRELIAVGAFPVAKRYEGINPWKRVLDHVLNVRSRHPMSEISKHNVEDFHQLALHDPQETNTSQRHELRSKIFFHGRLFFLRSKIFWNKPTKKSIVGDDSYLPDYIISKYGKNRIRIRYDANILFTPFTSLRSHYQTYKRIYFDLKMLKESYPKFKEIRKLSQLILDREYISKQSPSIRFKFKLFSIVRSLEKIAFKYSLNKEPSEIWRYNNK